MVSASQFNLARRVASMTPLMIDAHPAEMTTAEVALLAEMTVLPRLATTATSLATLQESAASPAVIAMIADQEADQTSKSKVTKYREINKCIGEEADSVVAAVAVTSEAEVEEEAVITVIVDPDTAAATREALAALLPDVTEDHQEVAANEQASYPESSLLS
jgi:hypothetical protein